MNSILANYIRKHSGLLLVILLALVIRIAYLVAYQGLPAWDQLTVDNYYHHNWAQNIADGNVLGDTTYFRAPFYVYCLALLYYLLGASLWVGRMFGLVIGVASIFMTYRIGRKIFDHRVGMIAATIHTIYPVIIYFESELLLDPLFALLLQVAIYRTLVWWDSNRPADIFTAGLMYGLAAITRPTVLIVVPLVIMLAWALQRPLKSAVKHSAVLLLGVVLTILPITLRNVLVASDPVLISSQGGINLYIGNNEVANGVTAAMPEPLGFNWRVQQVTHIAETDLGHKLKPGEVSSYWLRKSKDWILSNPGEFLTLYLKKLYRNFSDVEVSNNRDLGVFFARVGILNYNPLSFGILFGLTIAGCWICPGKNQKAVFLLTVIMTYTVMSALFFFSSRFRLPLLPLYIVLASATLGWLTTTILNNARAVLLPILAVILYGAFSFYPLVDLPKSNPSQYLISEGLFYLATEDYDRALTTFSKAHQIDPAFPETNLNLGATYMRLGRLDSALHYLSEEKRLHPGRTKASTNIASIYLLEGNFEQAAREIQAVIISRPYDVVANMVLMRSLFADSLIPKPDLIRNVNEAARRTGNDIRLINDAATRFASRGDLQLASEFLAMAAGSDPPPIETDDHSFEHNFINSRANRDRELAITYYQWGFVTGLGEQYAQSIEHSRTAIELDSTLAEAYINLASGYLLTSQLAEARSVVSLGVSKFPDNTSLKTFQLELNP